MKTSELERVEKALAKLWNNFLVEGDFHLYCAHGVPNGAHFVKDYVWHKLSQEINEGRDDWLQPR